MKKNAMSLKAMIKKIAKENNIAAQAVLQTYMMERLLERISLSEYKDNFILKGGMLISTMLGIGSRTTMDMDATIKRIALTRENIIDIVNKILKVEINDGVGFTCKKAEEIREDDEYGGFRISFDAIYDGMTVPFKIDITTGDSVTPREIKYRLRLMFEDRKIDIWAYNLETILAEKFETVIKRGIFSTRPRDFYDIYMLIKTQGKNIDKEILRNAIFNTAKHRNSINIMKNVIEQIDILKEDPDLEKQWQRYQSDNFYAEGITYQETIVVLYQLGEIVVSMRNEFDF